MPQSQTGTRPLVDLALQVNNVEVLNKRDFSRGNQISSECLNEFKRFWKKHDLVQGCRVLLNSVCSNIFERYEVKLGLLLSLIGGVSQKMDAENHSNIKIRGQIHMLMVGEPGTGKSQMLR